MGVWRRTGDGVYANGTATVVREGRRWRLNGGTLYSTLRDAKTAAGAAPVHAPRVSAQRRAGAPVPARKSAPVPAADPSTAVDLYLRKSKKVQNGDRSLSIRAQEDLGRAWADRSGYTVRHVWVDNESAFKAVDRPEFDAAMSALAAVEVGALWCYALDRFTRMGAGAITPVMDAGQRVVFDYEDLDSSRPRDRKWIIQRAEDAREHSERLAYNVKRTKERQRREGRWLGRAPFGLICDGARKLRPDTEPWVSSAVSRRTYSRWDVLSRIFHMIADGKSTRAVARELNAEGIPAPRTGRIDPAIRPSWRGSTIKYMIDNLAYEGWLTESSDGRRKPTAWRDDEGQRVRVAGHGVELIPAALAARARRSLHGTGATPKDPGKGRPKLLLTGLLRCEACGSGMTSKGDSYGCLRFHSGGDCPNPASIRRDHAEAYVSARWIAALNAAEPEDAFLLAVAERYAALRQPEASAEVVEAQEAVRAARIELAAFEKEFSAGVYKRQRAMALSLREQLTEDVEAAQAAMSALSSPTTDVSVFLNGWAAKAWEGAERSERRDFLRLAIDCIYVKRGKRGQVFVGDARMAVQWAGTNMLALAA
ncbi:hypothetical protein CTZ27_27120 [Streptomyces griseocarneus]|nr:hypothetical protein CTZ27_27120 [Streptomyces griseocarneus]